MNPTQEQKEEAAPRSRGMKLTDEQKAIAREKWKAWYHKNKESVARRRKEARAKAPPKDYNAIILKRRADRAYYEKNRDEIRWKRFWKHRKDTPEQIAARREYNRAAAAKYRRNKALNSQVL